MSILAKFNYKTFGSIDKPKLVFLHGLLGSANNWVSIIKEFEKNFNVLVYDQRGHGKSEHFDEYKSQDFAQDLANILQELGWNKINLVGHSMGARNAMVFAQMFPQILEKLVIEDIGAEPSSGASTNTIDMVKGVPVPFKDKAEAKKYLMGPFKEEFGETLALFMYTNLTSSAPVEWKFDINAFKQVMGEGLNRDFWQEWNGISCPCLLLRGERSHHLPQNIFDQMLSSNSGAQGVVIPKAGHWLHFEQRVMFIKALKDFLL